MFLGERPEIEKKKRSKKQAANKTLALSLKSHLDLLVGMCYSYLQSMSCISGRVLPNIVLPNICSKKQLNGIHFAETRTSTNNYKPSTGDLVFLECAGLLRRVVPVERADIRPGGSVYLFRY